MSLPFRYSNLKKMTIRNKKGVRAFPFLLGGLLVSAWVLSACAAHQSTSTQTEVTPSPLPTPSTSSTPIASTSPSPSPAPLAQTYRERTGAFEIAFPDGYQYQATNNGIAFIKDDKGFGGSVQFGPTDGKKLNAAQLETALKAGYEQRLDRVKWQNSQLQRDGSIRIAWLGTDKNRNTLDAVSFVEQRGNTVLVLNLFAINKPYQNYSADAKAIVGSYHPRTPTPAATKTPTSSSTNQAEKNAQ
jgi:hypothetical protein